MSLGANKIEIVPLEKLKPYERNARTHSEEQVKQIAASIREFGFTNPILIDGEKGIIAGHGRLAAAKLLGLTEVPTIDLAYLSPAQKRAYVLADNKLALSAGWDAGVLQAELSDLVDLDFNMESIGFSDDELDAILEAEDPTDVLEEGPAPTLRTELEERAERSVERREEKEKEREETSREESTEDPYTKKIQAPVYEPKGEKPSAMELVDSTKTIELREEILRAKLPDDISSFLLSAADRHRVFDYRKIAEFYAHAEPEVQNLMERSALVIIDFNKAIENGFVKLTSEIAEAYNSDGADE